MVLRWVFHLRGSLSRVCDEQWKKRLTKAIGTLFRSKKLTQVKKRYAHIMKLQQIAPENVSSVFDMLKKYFPKLCRIVVQKDIPKTTNPVERAIGEFEERYQLTKGFSLHFS
jgi:hypothetical protein